MAPRRFEVFRGNGIVASLIADALNEHDGVPPFAEIYMEGEAHEGAVIAVTTADDARRIADWVHGYVAGMEDSESDEESDLDEEDDDDELVSSWNSQIRRN